MNGPNKLDCLSLAKPFQPSIMFVRKERAYLSSAPFVDPILDKLVGPYSQHFIFFVTYKWTK